MQIHAIKTHQIEQSDSLKTIINRYLSAILEGDILVVSSKILSIIEGCVVEKNQMDYAALVTHEADRMVDWDQGSHHFYLTIKDGVLIPSAGIDESNGGGAYVLYPKDVQQTACWIWNYVREAYDLKEFGVLVSDSQVTIMRRGVTGIALGWCGFKPLYSYVNQTDLQGRDMRVTQTNILDSLATSAVYVMGEGDEQTPFAIIKGAPKITFLDRPPTKEEEESIKISPHEDLYAPLLEKVQWK
jgi:putative folate metabolism gamma-glutamate ligase